MPDLLNRISNVMWAAKIAGIDAGKKAFESAPLSSWECGRAELRLYITPDSEISQALYELVRTDDIASCVRSVEEVSDTKLAVAFTNMTFGSGQEMAVHATAYRAALNVIQRELKIDGGVLETID